MEKGIAAVEADEAVLGKISSPASRASGFKTKTLLQPLSPELVNDLCLHMLLLLEDSSPVLDVTGLQPCWSWFDRLATDFMKGTKAISALHPHTPALTPHSVLGRRQGGRDSGTVGQTEEMEGGFRGPVTDTLSCPELLRQSASPIVQQHPPFFIHHPLCPPPHVLSKDRL